MLTCTIEFGQARPYRCRKVQIEETSPLDHRGQTVKRTASRNQTIPFSASFDLGFENVLRQRANMDTPAKRFFIMSTNKANV